MLDLATIGARAVGGRHVVLLRPGGDRPRRQRSARALAGAPGSPGGGRRHPRGTDRRRGRGGLPGHDACAHHAARRAGPYGPPVHRTQRHPPRGPAAATGRRLARARGRPGRLHLRRAAAGGGRRRGRGGQRRARRGPGHAEPPLRAGPEGSGRPRPSCSSSSRGPGSRRPATPGRSSTPATARRRPSIIRSCMRWWRRAAQHPRRRWDGPTWPRSGSTGCRPPTSAPATRSSPITPTSGCRRRSWSGPTRCCSPSSPTLRPAQRTTIVPIMYWWMLQM